MELGAMPTYAIRHVTRYRYRQPVAFGEHRMMLRPRESHDQRTIAAEILITPAPVHVAWSEDAAGNLVGFAKFARRATELVFESSFQVAQVPHQFDPSTLAEYARTCPFSYGAEEMPELARFIERQHHDPEHRVDRWARNFRDSLRSEAGVETAAFLARLNETIRHDIAYLRREEPGVQSPAETLRLMHGSCRDVAVLMCEALRSQGFAARFVSGYLYVRHDEPADRQVGGNTHAWLQVYLPGAGWIDFDPTSGTTGNRDLIRVAVVRDPDWATPLSGTFIGFPSDDLGMDVHVRVTLQDGESRSAERFGTHG
ncbi:MAG TPA: transglutaminase family protein [Enterovirga sp.]|jgi:transglutaminase-like putative cysteine protease|nr:transglutaminase family protein [Enterovirga sp.]